MSEKRNSRTAKTNETGHANGGYMAKSTIWFIAVIVVGALLGSFLGKFITLVVPSGSVRDMFATEITAGLSPTTLNLRIVEFTFGCMLKLNVTSILGIIVAALIFRHITKA